MKKFTQATLIALLISSSVFSQRKDEPVKNPAGGTVVNQAANSQLILLSPADGRSFTSTEGSKPVLFRWTALSPKPKEAVTYRLRVWQLMQGQNGMEAMRNNQPLVTKELVNITQAAISNLYTGPCRPPYLCNFVWAVDAFNSDGISIVNGTSAISSFEYEGNKGNAGNSGMAGGKSLDAQGDPVHGVDVKLGVKSTTKQGDPVHGVDIKPAMKTDDKGTATGKSTKSTTTASYDVKMNKKL